MAKYYHGLDALQPFTEVANSLYSNGFDFAMRYLKNLSQSEIDSLRNNGVALGLIFEQGAGNAFKGASQGTTDGNAARLQADDFGVPSTVTIFTTVDADVDTSQLPIISDYLAAFTAAVTPYPVGIYACGVVLDYIKGRAVPWLAGAMGWCGSHECDDAGGWVIKQGPTLDDGGSWAGEDWVSIGFPYDPNLATNINWAWSPQRGPHPHIHIPTVPVLQLGDTGKSVEILQQALNAHPLRVDGDFGPVTDYAVRAFQSANGLPVDGIVGEDTWRCLDAVRGK
jgi:Putative peptidoglycan binding domain/Rv2525c-like, glycoside hydrolase-like domain